MHHYTVSEYEHFSFEYPYQLWSQMLYMDISTHYRSPDGAQTNTLTLNILTLFLYHDSG